MLYLRKIVPQCKVAQCACLSSTSAGQRMTFNWIGILHNFNLPEKPSYLNFKNMLFLNMGFLTTILKVLRSKVPCDTFRCVLCNKAYPYKFLLTRHMKRSHSTITFNCIYCSNVYKSSSSLQNHLKTHH